MGRRLLPLEGKSVLIVEDNFLIAQELRSMILDAGGKVLGPVSSAHMAAQFLEDIEGIDVAILDVRLADNSTCFPIANELKTLGVPFVIASAYDPSILPQELKTTAYLQKPFMADDLVSIVRHSIRFT